MNYEHDELDAQLKAEHVEAMKRLYKKHMQHPLMQAWRDQHQKLKQAYIKSYKLRDELLLTLDVQSWDD